MEKSRKHWWGMFRDECRRAGLSAGSSREKAVEAFKIVLAASHQEKNERLSRQYSMLTRLKPILDAAVKQANEPNAYHQQQLVQAVKFGDKESTGLADYIKTEAPAAEPEGGN